MADFVWRDGQRLTAWMLYVINLLDADLFQVFGVHVLVSSAIRTYAEQEAIFRARYVTAGAVNGRRVYDTRVWKGVRWYRISAAGTVAVPGSSNHEIQGSKAAVDIRDTGSGAGITVASSARGRWIRDWCRRSGLLIASGDGFGEGWHFDVPGIFRTPPKGDDMGAIDPTPANKQVIKDALLEFMRDTGPTIDGQPWRFMGSVWQQDIQQQDVHGRPQTDAKGQPIRFRAWGFLASTNAQAADIRENGAPVALPPEAISVLAAAISAKIEAGATRADVEAVVAAQLGRLRLAAEPETP